MLDDGTMFVNDYSLIMDREEHKIIQRAQEDKTKDDEFGFLKPRDVRMIEYEDEGDVQNGAEIIILKTERAMEIMVRNPNGNFIITKPFWLQEGNYHLICQCYDINDSVSITGC